jgi:uncharacterized protein YegL
MPEEGSYKGWLMSRLVHVWSGKHCWISNSGTSTQAWATDTFEVTVPLDGSWTDARGYGQHESSHIRFSNFHAIKKLTDKLVADYNIDEDYAHWMINLVEDLRIETLFPKLFKGAGDEFHDLRERLHTKAVAEKNFMDCYLNDVYCTTFGLLAPDANKKGSTVGDEVRKLVTSTPSWLVAEQATRLILDNDPNIAEHRPLEIPQWLQDLVKEVSKKATAKVPGETQAKPDEEQVKKDMGELEKQIKKMVEKIEKQNAEEQAAQDEKNVEKRLMNRSKKCAGESMRSKRIPSFINDDDTLFKKNSISRNAAMKNYTSAVAKHGKEIETLRQELLKIAGKKFPLPSTRGKLCMNRAVSNIASGGRLRTIFKRPDVGRDVDVVLLVDQSGSMCGEKVQEAMEAIVTFTEAVRAMSGVKLGVYGFASTDRGSGYKDLLTMKYKDFDSNECMRIGAINALNACNREGFHLRFVENELMSHSSPAKKRLFVMLSDGMPTDYDSSRFGGKDDTKKAANEIRADGTSFICIGFVHTGADDSDRDRLIEQLSDIYGEKSTVPCIAGTGQLNNVLKSIAFMISRMLGAN